MGRRHTKLRIGVTLAALACVPAMVSCVTIAEHRKLEREVSRLQRGQGSAGRENQNAADLAVEIEELRSEVDRLAGRVEVAEHQAQSALSEARSAREQSSGAPASPGPEGASPGPPAGMDRAGDAPDSNASAGEVQAYREAHSAWRAGDTQACIDRFQQFLQNYASSGYADDAAFWMADCYFRQGDYQLAILRFDDVPRMYPTGNKAADALYRQGEALIRLGPSYSNAARRAFERVIEEYPDSPRVPEARIQLEALGTG